MSYSTLLFDAVRHLQYRAWKTSDEHGWHEPRDHEGVVRKASNAERISLVHSELSEALEELRAGRYDLWFDEGKSNHPQGLLVEIADVVIRCLDLAEIVQQEHPDLEVDFARALSLKMDFNDTRPMRHGGKLL